MYLKIFSKIADTQSLKNWQYDIFLKGRSSTLKKMV